LRKVDKCIDVAIPTEQKYQMLDLVIVYIEMQSVVKWMFVMAFRIEESCATALDA